MRPTFRFAAALALAGAVLAACSGGATPTPAPTAAPTEAPSAAPTEAPTPTPNACAPENLATVTAGTLTIGTDNPAYPPYFDGDPADPAWEIGNPNNGKGFESAVAYAVAEKLGFTKDQVTWIAVKFDNAYAPGPKAFDFDINQVSYTPERAQSVDMTDGYYTVNQAVVALKGSPLASATKISELAAYKFGAQAGTTSYDTIVNVIKPTQEAAVFDSNDAVITALQNKQIDGMVVDLPTAFYATAAQIVDADFNPLANIVGQFAAPTGADAEHFSMVLTQGSPLTACVNQALAALKSDGTLDQITTTWLADKASAPVFQP